MDFELNDSLQGDKKRHILLTLNGQADAEIIKFRFFQGQITMHDIKKKMEKHFKMKISWLRLYTQQGVEIFEEDLLFIKEGTLLYVSDSSEFDAYSQISVYQIMKVLGEGGFGKVMLGKHKISGEQVAIKLIDSGKLWNAEDIDLVFREAEVMKNLRHNNIVKILNCYTLPNMQVVLIMEFLQGGDLVEYLQEKGGLSEQEARIIFRQIAEAIRYCHDKRLIHRDLKLENILLTSKIEKIIKIIDFGIATVSTNFTIDKVDRGSLSYMPPELMSGQAIEIKPSIDIWALGVILYALVCGNLPFTSKNDEQTIDNILKCNYSFPPSLTLTKEYKDLIINMLNPDQNQRYSAYQVIRHPWMQKVVTQSPPNLLSPKVIATKKMIKKEVTMAGGPNRNQQLQLRGGVTMMRPAVQSNQNSAVIPIIYEFQTRNQQDPQSPRSSFLDNGTNRSVQEPLENQSQDKAVPKTQAIRKYSDFNQKLIDRIFREDSKREKVKKWKSNSPTMKGSPIKQQNQGSLKQCTSCHFNSTRTTNTSPYTISRSTLHTPNLISPRQSSENKKRSYDKLEIQTIINLSQRVEWKQLYSNQVTPQNNIQSRRNTMSASKADMLYKLQIQFKQRQKNQDIQQQKKLYENNKEMTIQKLCNIIFSSRIRKVSHFYYQIISTSISVMFDMLMTFIVYDEVITYWQIVLNCILFYKFSYQVMLIYVLIMKKDSCFLQIVILVFLRSYRSSFKIKFFIFIYQIKIKDYEFQIQIHFVTDATFIKHHFNKIEVVKLMWIILIVFQVLQLRLLVQRFFYYSFSVMFLFSYIQSKLK
ncbi:unnamed protein product [Paramecium pentaurelia]|uniref:Protein kinase domain-containing protein n=1 Tax=Paramecium pentaurelia TaxID=43138 RepID=A0A8S1WUR8_9CILI|nr:unnamed protein product [Paramecium pentaurelia]